MIDLSVWQLLGVGAVGILIGMLAVLVAMKVLSKWLWSKEKRTTSESDFLPKPGVSGASRVSKTPDILGEALSASVEEPSASDSASVIRLSDDAREVLTQSIGRQKLLTIDQAANILGVTTKAVRQWVNQRDIRPVVSDDGRRWVTPSELLRFLNQVEGEGLSGVSERQAEPLKRKRRRATTE